MSNAWSFYRLDTGMFTGQKLFAASQHTESNTPTGCGVIEGDFDHLSQRVDLTTGQVVDWQPAPPAEDGFYTWAWDTATRRWVSTPTEATLYLEERARIIAAIVALEATQDRPTRELALDPNNDVSRAKLTLINSQIAALRAGLIPV
jgi:hypothetical protein